ncbi:aminoacyl-histidine dipeptidase [Massilibacteroides sp.]|uniref:aminoacyl-histidine dipeptidase n=1 Tax=Massilibacteroides sp. TaxID=2034766 RepID=UPI002609CE6B|nr:aminoacyl-histidine dipeptidase [Massilibacteroides sp.]MDD4515950.1 aminoacyl-histidine dipeptidase [Massilibacteroides sp.]
MKITDLNPKIVWKFFHEITQVPRPSKKEGKIIQYLEAFAKEHTIAIKKDEAGNILMSKPATPGYEKLPTVILQSHVDMVCEKNSGTEHDFDNDPIETIVDGDWLKAKDTTLGADNGVGVAAELAILASDDIEHGPIECLFTIDEETGLTGAKELKAGFMTGEILLNLDSEDEGEIFIGCAGGKDTQALFSFTPTPTDPSLHYVRIDVKGLNGGHSGGEIHKGLGNANKILVRFLYLLKKKYDIVLCEINGGNLRNAIAREAYAVVGIPESAKEDVRIMLNQFTADVENELKHIDKNVKLLLESVPRPEKAIDNVTAEKIIFALQACPHGVIGMSHEIEGLVETSTNLASVKTLPDNTVLVGTSQRSSIESYKLAVANQVAATFLLAGAKVTHGDGYPGWAPNSDSLIMKVAQESYKRLFGKEAAIKAIHAGLECGLFLEKYPYLDMISFGPTLRDVHSPNERIQISTVDLWWKHLLDVLKSIPAK